MEKRDEAPKSKVRVVLIGVDAADQPIPYRLTEKAEQHFLARDAQKGAA